MFSIMNLYYVTSYFGFYAVLQKQPNLPPNLFPVYDDGSIYYRTGSHFAIPHRLTTCNSTQDPLNTALSTATNLLATTCNTTPSFLLTTRNTAPFFFLFFFLGQYEVQYRQRECIIKSVDDSM